MKGIQCRSGHVFSMIIDSESNSSMWKLEEHYYKSQGCEVVKSESLSFSLSDGLCSHCESLEHNLETLIEDVILNNLP